MSTARGRGRGRGGSRAPTSTATNGRTGRNTTTLIVNQRGDIEEEILEVQPKLNFVSLCRDFTSLGEKPFFGTEPILGVQQWLRTCEQIFKDLELEDHQKRLLASRQMQKAALDWWDSITATTPEREISWADFKERFEAQFMKEAGMAQLFREFLDLK